MTTCFRPDGCFLHSCDMAPEDLVTARLNMTTNWMGNHCTLEMSQFDPHIWPMHFHPLFIHNRFGAMQYTENLLSISSHTLTLASKNEWRGNDCCEMRVIPERWWWLKEGMIEAGVNKCKCSIPHFCECIINKKYGQFSSENIFLFLFGHRKYKVKEAR